MSAISGFDPLDEKPEVKKLTGKYAKLEKDVAAMWGSMSMFVCTMSQPDGVTLLEHTNSFSYNLVNASTQNEKLYEALVTVTQGTIYSTVITESVVIVLSLLANHGITIQSVLGKLKSQFRKKDESGNQNSVNSTSESR